MTSTTPETLAELRRLLNAGTPVPWAQGDPTFGGRNAQCVVSISERAMGRDVMGPMLRPALFDMELIVAAVTALPALLDAAAERDALAAKLDAVREWIDKRGVNVSDRGDDWMTGYRSAQRQALLGAAELRRALDEEAPEKENNHE